MICYATSAQRSTPAWHAAFLAMLPAITATPASAFRHLTPRLARRPSRRSFATAAPPRPGWPSWASWTWPIPPSGPLRRRPGQRRPQVGLQAQRPRRALAVLPAAEEPHRRAARRLDEEENAWQEVLVEDHHTGPADMARDTDGFRRLAAATPRRNRRIAQFLSLGNRTSDAARKFGTSEARVSQLRRELAENWQAFVGDEACPAVA